MSPSLFDARVTRRAVLIGAGAAAAGGVVALHSARSAAQEITLVAQERMLPVLGASAAPTPVMTFGDGFPSPLLRVRQGEPMRVRLVNRLKQSTTIHWHGIRLPNAMDGVPNLTQPPVEPGQEFVYAFTPPDAGTFWYHPHFDSLDQLAHGLLGGLIVDEAEAPAFDADILLLIKDWNLGDDGQYRPLTSPKAAGRAGTFGDTRTVNGSTDPVYQIPAGGLCRLRLLNTDITRIYKIIIEGGSADVVALDGNPVDDPYPLELQELGPGMRADLVLRAPAAGATIRLINTSTNKPWTMATLTTVADARVEPAADLPRLPRNPIPEPDLAKAISLPLAFSAGVGNGASICSDGKTVPIFWSINKQTWPEASMLLEPLATLRRNQTYMLDLANLTPHTHPIHLHGHSFKVLESNKRDIRPHWADTVLLAPDERVKAAFVADNPGDWMIHCHIIEHQVTGMMGYLRIA
jgi:FtsP/CotA-like multicopper oxidase with cupredoxin domain